MISDELKAEILARTDLVKLIGEHVDLRKAGASFKGRCPFHNEKTPSFQVSPQRGTYHCFGCQAHGDAIRFLMEHGGRTFIEALRELAGRVGIEVPEERSGSYAERAAQKEKKTRAAQLLEVQDKLCAYYTRALFGPPGEAARRYLSDRGIRRETAEAFRLGWADGEPEPLAAFVAEAGIERLDLVALGILVEPEADEDRPRREGPFGGARLRFFRRLMCPVVDLRGEVTGFSGRIIESRTKAPKYLNSPETPVFKKGEQLYGAHTARLAARKAGRLVLCEGNLDVVTLWQAGFEGTAAPMGTALTAAQVRLAKRLSEQVVCVMDGDSAGQKAAHASLLPFLEAGIQPRAVLMPAGEDPDSFVRKEGPAAFGLKLDAAPPLFDLVIEHAAAGHPPDPPGRLAALRSLAPALSALDDVLARALYRARIAERLGLPADLVDAACAEAQAAQEAALAAERRRTEARAAPAPGTPGGPAAGATPSARSAEPRRPALAAPEPVDDVPWAPRPAPATPAGRVGPVEAPGGGLGVAPGAGPELGLPDAPPPWWTDDQDAGPEGEPRAPGGHAQPTGAPNGAEAGADTGADPGEPTDLPDWLTAPAGSTGGGNLPASAASKRPVRVPRYEEEALEFILVFPELALRLRGAGADDSLTDGRVAAFVSSLCDEIAAGRTPDADRLLAQEPDPMVVAFLRSLQGRRSPTIDEQNRLAAFDEAVRRLRAGHLKQSRTALLERLTHAAPEERNALRAAYDEVRRKLRDLQTPTGEGAG